MQKSNLGVETDMSTLPAIHVATFLQAILDTSWYTHPAHMLAARARTCGHSWVLGPNYLDLDVGGLPE